MTQRFSGPWTISVKTVAPYPDRRYEITGSNNADGVYPVPFLAAHPPLEVQGEDWTLEIQCQTGHTETWVNDSAYPPLPQGGERSSSRFDPQLGLVIQVGTGTLAYDSPPSGAIEFSGLRLICTSMDPDLNPGPLPPHPDFTVPGEHSTASEI
jgi:hypothetical protein